MALDKKLNLVDTLKWSKVKKITAFFLNNHKKPKKLSKNGNDIYTTPVFNIIDLL